MTVSSQTSSVSYAGDDVTVLFTVPYYFLADPDLTVILSHLGAETTLVLNSDYSVTGEGNPAGGEVLLVVPPQIGETLEIRRVVALTQDTDYVANDAFPAASHERALDKLTMIDQQHSLDIGTLYGLVGGGFAKALRVPENVPVIAAAASRANMLLGFDGAGNPYPAAPVTSSAADLEARLRDPVNPANGATIVAKSAVGVTSLAELAGLPTDRKLVANLVLGGRSGLFRFDATNHSADVSSDSLQGIYVAPTSAPSGASGAWVRLYSEGIAAAWFGAVFDGTDQTQPIREAIKQALRVAATFGTLPYKLSGVPVDLPRGVALVQPNFLSDFSDVNVYTFVLQGQGMFNTSLMLAANGQMGTFAVSNKMLFPTFKDIGFYGDNHPEAAAADVTFPVNTSRRFALFDKDGSQGFRYYNCLFSRFYYPFVYDGINNESEMKFIGCKFLRNVGYARFANLQALNHEHVSCDFEQYVGDLISIPNSDLTGNDGVLGGGSLKFYGGSIIPFLDASPAKLINVQVATSEFNKPTVVFNDIKVELRGDSNGIVEAKGSNLIVFRGGSIATTNSAGGIKEMMKLHPGGRVVFDGTVFGTSGTAAVEQWNIIGGATFLPDLGRVEFKACGNEPNPSQILFDSTDGVNFPAAICENSERTNVGVADNHPVSWSLGGRQSRVGTSKFVAPVHRAQLNSSYLLPVNGQSFSTILPEGATILRVYAFALPQGSATQTATYEFKNAAGTVLLSTVVADQKDGLIFNKTINDFAAPALARVTGTEADRTYTFSVLEVSGHQTMEGEGFIEYY